MAWLKGTREVAAYLRVNEHTAGRIIGSGELPAYRVGGSAHVALEDADKWMRSQPSAASENAQRRQQAVAAAE